MCSGEQSYGCRSNLTTCATHNWDSCQKTKKFLCFVMISRKERERDGIFCLWRDDVFFFGAASVLSSMISLPVGAAAQQTMAGLKLTHAVNLAFWGRRIEEWEGGEEEED